MTGWDLRVVWPIEDAAMYDAEAITAAWFQVPGFAERNQVTIAGQPRMRVEKCTPEQRATFRAARVVVCEVPVIRRIPTELSPAAECGNPTERQTAA